MSVTITVDGRRIEAPEGARLIDVCNDNGFEIPHFCYHPGLGPDGNCRMCQVEFVGERGNRLGISCNAIVADGMEVLTKSEAVLAARRSVEEFLLLNHPLDCPICDKAGECTLQNYYMAHDLSNSRMEFVRFKKEKAKDIGPTLILDQQRCVLCDRCVRFLRDIAGEEQLYIAGRGHGAYITTFPGSEVTSAYSLNTVDICPVGALTSKDFRFASPTWLMQTTPSVCQTCARGCSMEIQTRRNKIMRMRPRHNPEVNGYWMCDEGRLNYRHVNENRLTKPRVKRDGQLFDTSFEEAYEWFRRLLGHNGAAENATRSVEAAVLVSANATLEEMFTASRLAERHMDGAPVFAVRHVADGVEDDILRRADRHANARGAEMLGLEMVDLRDAETEPGGDAGRVGGVLGAAATVLCVGFNVGVSETLKRVVASAGRSIVVAGCESALTESADVVVPGVTFAEKEGLVVNFDGVVQRLRPALGPPEEGAPAEQKMRNRPVPKSDWRVLDAVSASLEGREPLEFDGDVRRAIVVEVAAFAGLGLDDVGPLGVRGSAQPVG